MKIKKEQWSWTREPASYTIEDDKIEIVTAPHTDLWQRTYYHFRNDNFLKSGVSIYIDNSSKI